MQDGATPFGSICCDQTSFVIQTLRLAVALLLVLALTTNSVARDAEQNMSLPTEQALAVPRQDAGYAISLSDRFYVFHRFFDNSPQAW
jgi:hypothetical protein